jgi:Ca2+-binding RTX toxin-like protein
MMGATEGMAMARIYDPGSDIPTYDPVDSDPPISDPADTTPTASQPVTSDTLYGSGGSSIQGTDGADKLGGGRYNDTLHGLGGNDVLDGYDSSDMLFGDGGNDQLNGGRGYDTLDGGIGNDTLDGGSGVDSLVGGDGIDWVSYASASIGVMVDLTYGGITNDASGDIYSGIENVVGSQYGDILNGSSGSNTMIGGYGDDWVFGQDGNDMLNAGYGWDHMSGGSGADTFVSTGGDGPYADVINDFQQGVDRIGLAALGQTPFGSDGQLEQLYHEGSLVNAGWYSYQGPEGDTVVFNEADHTLYQVTTQAYYDDDYYDWYNRITSATPIATFIVNQPSLTTNDFVIM